VPGGAGVADLMNWQHFCGAGYIVSGVELRRRPGDPITSALRMPDTPVTPARGSTLPARRLTTEQMEAVFRRAVELQARDSDSADDAGLTEDELLRIGGELGIGRGHMRRALAEVAVGTPAPGGAGARIFGPARIGAARAVPGRADAVRAHIERYLVDSQYLAVLRRLPDVTVYEKSGGLQVEVARAMDAMRGALGGSGSGPRIGAGFDLRTARTVEVSVTPIEENVSWTSFTVDLGNQRTGYWVGINSGVGVAALTGAAIAAIAIAPPAALLALPIMGGSAWGTRAAYDAVLKRARLHLEALLDHLERGESLVPGAAGRTRPPERHF
jgi:hypothetical protein